MASHLKDFIVVEEDDDHFHYLKTAFDNSDFENRPLRVENPTELQALLEQPENSGLAHFKPRIVILGMPHASEVMWEFLELRRERIDLRKIPLIVFSSPGISSCETQKLYDYGVNSLVLKPKSEEEYKKLIETMGQYWFGIVMLPSFE